MEKNKKKARYERIYKQLEQLFIKCKDPGARMASICAVLHYKMESFFWTGFYLLQGDKLIVSTYQGPLACMQLAKNQGVCWAGINNGEPVVVPDVEQFPGHIACDSRSKSEIVIPVRDPTGKIIGVLDIDSKVYNSFDKTDSDELLKIIDLIFIYD